MKTHDDPWIYETPIDGDQGATYDRRYGVLLSGTADLQDADAVVDSLPDEMMGATVIELTPAVRMGGLTPAWYLAQPGDEQDGWIGRQVNE